MEPDALAFGPGPVCAPLEEARSHCWVDPGPLVRDHDDDVGAELARRDGGVLPAPVVGGVVDQRRERLDERIPASEDPMTAWSPLHGVAEHLLRHHDRSDDGVEVERDERSGAGLHGTTQARCLAIHHPLKCVAPRAGGHLAARQEAHGGGDARDGRADLVGDLAVVPDLGLGVRGHVREVTRTCVVLLDRAAQERGRRRRGQRTEHGDPGDRDGLRGRGLGQGRPQARGEDREQSDADSDRGPGRQRGRAEERADG